MPVVDGGKTSCIINATTTAPRTTTTTTTTTANTSAVTYCFACLVLLFLPSVLMSEKLSATDIFMHQFCRAILKQHVIPPKRKQRRESTKILSVDTNLQRKAKDFRR
ncbi:hypothetical protein GQX74_002071 [Glossina fuscipes]|nr:hypothetical protein GQX74_002071 [Glossina fuscipes]